MTTHLSRAAFALAAVFIVFPGIARAATPAQMATVYVICDTRQGSGTLVSTADGGYVVTVGHVPINPQTRQRAETCTVAFPTDDSLQAKAHFDATIVHAVYEERADRDLGVLKIGARRGPNANSPFTLPAPVPVSETAVVGDSITVLGYPGGEPTQKTSPGVIQAFGRGIIDTTAPIEPGYSGGPAVDVLGRLVGIAERVRYEIDETTGEQRVTQYQYADALTLITWLDEFAPGEHDRILQHADFTRFHSAPFVIRDEGAGCSYVVRTQTNPTVYCLLSGAQRLVFPNEATFLSWYPDTSGVQYIALDNLADYKLIGNMTMRARSLVKIQTDPKVYVVTDSLGTMRALPSEQRAAELFGLDWAKKVRDVPDSFFVDYRPAAPIL